MTTQAASDAIRNNLSVYLSGCDCNCDCDDLPFIINAFNNDIDTLLNDGLSDDQLTDLQIDMLIAFAGVATAVTPVYIGNGAISGGSSSSSSSSGSSEQCCEIDDNYPYTGYDSDLNTYQYDVSSFTIEGLEIWIEVDGNYEYVGIPEDMDELLEMLNDMGLGAFSLDGDTLSAVGHHSYGTLYPIQQEVIAES